MSTRERVHLVSTLEFCQSPIGHELRSNFGASFLLWRPLESLVDTSFASGLPSKLEIWQCGRQTEIRETLKANWNVKGRVTLSEIYDGMHIMVILDLEADATVALTCPIQKIGLAMFRLFRYSPDNNTKHEMGECFGRKQKLKEITHVAHGHELANCRKKRASKMQEIHVNDGKAAGGPMQGRNGKASLVIRLINRTVGKALFWVPP
ncbi:hypothetical protein QQ045_012551 [Rhodiola kirilowii]